MIKYIEDDIIILDKEIFELLKAGTKEEQDAWEKLLKDNGYKTVKNWIGDSVDILLWPQVLNRIEEWVYKVWSNIYVSRKTEKMPLQNIYSIIKKKFVLCIDWVIKWYQNATLVTKEIDEYERIKKEQEREIFFNKYFETIKKNSLEDFLKNESARLKDLFKKTLLSQSEEFILKIVKWNYYEDGYIKIEWVAYDVDKLIKKICSDEKAFKLSFTLIRKEDLDWILVFIKKHGK